jgi:hypothetical protein
MKKIILSTILVAGLFSCKENKKPTPKPHLYELTSPMILDSNGNVTIIKKVVDHIPTREDSISVFLTR